VKLVRYDRNGAVRLGAIDGDEVVDLLDAAPVGTDARLLAAMSDMTRLIEAGDAGLAAVRAAVTSRLARIPLRQAKLKAAIEPTLILCSGERHSSPSP
jgi:hypothetical protein